MEARAHSLTEECRHSITLFALPFLAVLRNASRITSISGMHAYGCGQNNGILFMQDSLCLSASLALVLGPWRSSRRLARAVWALHIAWHISDVGMQGTHMMTADSHVYLEFALRFVLAACCPYWLAQTMNAGISVLWCCLCYATWGFETYAVFALASCSTVVEMEWVASFNLIVTSLQSALSRTEMGERSLLTVYQFTDQPPQTSFWLFVVDELMVFLLVAAALSTWNWLLWTLIFANIRLKNSKGIQRALLGTLDCLCDCVVQLDSTLRVATPAPKLASLLLRSGSENLSGAELFRFTATAQDAALLDAALAKAAATARSGELAVNSCSELVSFTDAYQAEVRVQIIPAHFEDADGESCYIIGMNELSQRVGPAGCDSAEDVVGEMVRQPPESSPSSQSPRPSSRGSLESADTVQITFPSDEDGMVFMCARQPPHSVLRVDSDLTKLLGPDSIAQARASGLIAWFSQEDADAVSTWLEAVSRRVEKEVIQDPRVVHFGNVASLHFALEKGLGLSPWLTFTFVPALAGDDGDGCEDADAVQTTTLSDTVLCEIHCCPRPSIESQLLSKATKPHGSRKASTSTTAKKPRKSRTRQSSSQEAGGTPASGQRCKLDATSFGRGESAGAFDAI